MVGSPPNSAELIGDGGGTLILIALEMDLWVIIFSA